MPSAKLLAALAAAAIALASPAAASAASPAVAVYPSPNTSWALPGTQITFRGISPSLIGPVVVKGSSSGTHTGKIEADSDGKGGSFVPTQPFTKGETVTVTTSLNIIGGSGGTFTFKIGTPQGPIGPAPLAVVPAGSNGVAHYRSRPDLEPPAVSIAHNTAPAAEGDLFLSPQFGPVQNGPMIVDPSGQLVWFHPVPVSAEQIVTDFRLQRYQGAPVLTWFQGITDHGSGSGEGVIYDRNYRQIATVHAGNGTSMDLHEFLISGNDAYIVAVQPSNVSGVGKPTMDGIVQEIDIKTGLVLFEWNALDHIPTSYTYFPPSTPGFVFDPYHINSVYPTSDGDLLVSMRNTSAVYKIDRNTGQVIWELGGKHSSFKMGSGTSTADQHDAVQQPDGSLTIFDDGAGPPAVHKYSRGIRVSVNTQSMTASLANQYPHSPQISTNFEGSVQQLSGGDVFLGWGQQPYFSEDNASGQQILDGRFVSNTSSYRAYRFAWSAQPPTQPALAVSPSSNGNTELYASWNGATDVTGWQILAGPDSQHLVPLGSSSRTGFETAISVHSNAPYFAVKALGSGGKELASSPVVPTPAHIAVYGRSVFASAQGTGGIPAGCFATHPCSVSTTVTAGRTVIATTGREALGQNSGGLLFFHLSSQGRSLLAKARSNELPVNVTLHDSSGTSASSNLTLIRFSSSGSGPHRSVSQSSALQLIGLTDFVNPRGTGGILAACYSSTPCHVAAALSVGKTVISRTGQEWLGPDMLGYVIFNLTSTGQSMLAHASGNQLGVQVKLTASQGTATGQLALVGFK